MTKASIYVGIEFDAGGNLLKLSTEDIAWIRTDTLNDLAREFSGATSYDTHGSWIDSHNNNVVERGLVFTVIYPERDEHLDKIILKRIADSLKRDLKQESVLIEYAYVTTESV